MLGEATAKCEQLANTRVVRWWRYGVISFALLEPHTKESNTGPISCSRVVEMSDD